MRLDLRFIKVYFVADPALNFFVVVVVFCFVSSRASSSVVNEDYFRDFMSMKVTFHD